MEIDGRERFRLYPSLGFRLYAMGFKDGRTKIGISSRPRKRFLAHWRASNGAIAWTHLFGPHDSTERIESLACELAAKIGERIRRTEEFRGLDREQTIQCVRAAIKALD